MGFLQRRHSNGQQACEQLRCITNHQVNANQNHNETSPHIGQNDHHKTNFKKIIGAGKVVEKMECLHTEGGEVNWGSHCEK